MPFKRESHRCGYIFAAISIDAVGCILATRMTKGVDSLEPIIPIIFVCPFPSLLLTRTSFGDARLGTANSDARQCTRDAVGSTAATLVLARFTLNTKSQV